MFNQQSNQANDFTPPWLKLSLPRERRPQSLHWVHSTTGADGLQTRKTDSILQKDDFPCLVEVPTAQRRGGSTSAWSAPLVPSSPSPTPPTSTGLMVSQPAARNGGNRMYKAMLPRNLTRRVLAPRPTNQAQDSSPQNRFQQEQQRAALDNSNRNVDSNSKEADGSNQQTFQRLAGSSPATTSTSSKDHLRENTAYSSNRPRTTSDIVHIQQANWRTSQNYCGNDVYNQNVLPPASPCCDEAEERLLRAMGWKHEEVACEGPLTPEEITEATHWSHHSSTAAILARQHRQPEEAQRYQEDEDDKFDKLLQLKHHLKYSFGDHRATDRLRSAMQKHEREFGSLGGRGAQLEHALRMGSDLKKALLATMGVVADSDLEDENEESDTDC